MPSVVIGLDIGTTSVSCVAISAKGMLLAAATRTHNAYVQGLPDGFAEQNARQLREAACETLRDVAATCGACQVMAVGLTGQMHSTVLLNDAFAVIGNVITWQDRRSLTVTRSGRTILEELQQRAGADHTRGTGCRLSAGYLGTTLAALRHLEQFPADCRHVCFVADWLLASLAGQPPCTDRSHAASSGIYDLQLDCWSRPLLSAADVDLQWLPDVRESGMIVGQMSKAAAADTGLPTGTPLCNAIGDNQAAVISSLPTGEHSLLINIGTGGQIVWRVPEFRRVAGMDTRYLPAAQDLTRFMLVGAGLCGGDAYAWINRTVRSWLADFGCERSENEVWQVIARQMEQQSAMQTSLVCEPFFAGTRPEPDRRAVFRGVGKDNFTAANIAGSILHGIATTMYDVYEAAAGNRPQPLKHVAMSGNGARQNPLLVKAVADRFGVPVSVSPCREEAATGAAMLAGVKVGCWASLDAAGNLIHAAADIS